MDYLWGIDLGGTKIEGVVLDSRDLSKVICRKRVATEASKGYDHILSVIKDLIVSISNETGLKPEKIGYGTPGTIDSLTQQLKNSNTVCLIGKPLKDDLKKITDAEVVLANDANCFALAETHMGIVKDKMPNAEVVFGIIMGTGVGGGIVVNGKVINGRHGIAGEWGHNFLDESGGVCYCGRSGCVETIISGPALEKYYFLLSGKNLSLKDIVRKAEDNQDDNAIKTMNRLTQFFGKAMAPIINIIDPDVVVLGGGVGNVETLYSSGVLEIKKYLFNNAFDTLFLKPKLGDSAGVFGAAALVL